MTMMEVNIILGLGIFILSAISFLLLLQSEKKVDGHDQGGEKNKSRKPEQEKIPLTEISKVWIKRDPKSVIKKKEIHIAELAPIWRKEVVQNDIDEPLCEFKSPRIQAFYQKHIQPISQAGLQQTVCRKLLLLLDAEGQCPSVVNAKDDVESSLNSNVYDILGKTNLIDHTLNVAEQILLLLENTDNKFMTPDMLVAALAHDLGKFPSRKGYLYSMGEHPLVAGQILAGIDEFEQLKRKDEILKAVKLHHKKPEGFVGKTLKRADQFARQMEYDKTIAKLQPADQDEIMKAMESVMVKNKGKNGMEIFYEEVDSDKKSGVPELVDISKWFVFQPFLNAMKPYINKVTGRRFMAFTMPNGYVYFQTKVLEEIARKQAEDAGVLDVASMEDEEMQGVLLSITRHLRQEAVFAGDLLKKNYFGGYFTINFKSGFTLKGYYTPCHAEAFGSIAVMEKDKTGILLEFVSVESFHES